MCSPLSTPRCSHTFPSVTRSVLVAMGLVFLVLFTPRCAAENATLSGLKGDESVGLGTTPTTVESAQHGDTVDYAKAVRDAVACGMASIPSSVLKKLLAAEIRPQCSVALFQTMRAFQNLEPWAMRLMDATGKYPTGLLQGSRADVGAYDECLETVVRDSYGHDVSHGQYCNLVFYSKNATAIESFMESAWGVLHPKMRYYKGHFTYMDLPMLRLGICFLDDCNQEDLQSMVDSVKPSIIDIRVTNCLTAEPVPWSTTQKAIVIFLGLLALAIAAATLTDLFLLLQPKCGEKRSALVQFAMAFSVVSNTRVLLMVADRADADRYSLQFLHGLRLFSLGHVVLGHCFMTISDSVSRMLNFLIDSTQWPSLIITGAFNSVDTFFFLSGFFLCFIITKQSRNGPILFALGVVRRLIRTCVPLFCILMCFYILPLFISGPDSKTFFLTFHEEVAEHWWHLLLHIQNFYKIDARMLLGHIWYLSADFQLFVVALPVMLLLKNRKTLALGTFTLLGLLSYAVVVWTLASNPDIQPFIIIPGTTPQGTLQTISDHYQRPFCHGMCYFSGCITCLLIDNFRERKISKAAEITGWCVATIGMLCCFFMKFAWYKNPHPTSEAGTMLAVFADRFLWSVSLAWITLTCSTGRGGVFARFLSCNVFVPLSKLSFGVYIIHLPFIELMQFASRERLFWSHFNQVSLFFSVMGWSYLLSYISYAACEAPTAAIDRLAFSRLRGSASERRKNEASLQNGLDIGADKPREGITFSRC